MMRKDRERIFQLRREGRTYREIHRDTGVSRATLSNWFRDIEWSKQLSQEHVQKNIGSSKDRMERLNMVRKLKLQYEYALVESEAKKEYEAYKNEPLFWAGLMLYVGKGDRRSKHHIRLSSIEPYVHRIFTGFAKKYLQIKSESIKCALVGHGDLDQVVARQFWKDSLGIEEGNFHKTQVLRVQGDTKRLQYGVAISIISNTSLKKRLMKWLSLAQRESFDNAIIV